MTRKTIVGGLLLTLLCSVGLASMEGYWLHVRVEDLSGSSEKVIVNLPLQLVESILPAIQTDELYGGKLRLDAHDLEGIDLREVLQALRDAPDANFVKVQSDDGTVHVAKERDLLIVRAEEQGGDRVRVTMPMAVVEAMLGSGRDEIDLIAGLRALADYEGGDLVSVDSEEAKVRVWIDSSEDGE